MRIRIRWIDLFMFRLPRFVVNGRIVDAEASRRIRTIVSDEAWTIAFCRRQGLRRTMLCMALGGMIGGTIPLLILLTTSSRAFEPINDYLNTLPEWSDPLIAIPFGLAAGFPFLYLIGYLGIWWQYTELVRAIRIVGSTSCLYCGYDLRGNDHSEQCPECGAKPDAMAEGQEETAKPPT
jgi:hypothetical protein